MTASTIIVVTYNSARWLARQRAALEAQTATEWKMIVVDNASAPDQRPKPGDLPNGARLVQSEVNLGFAAANNLAAAEADTPFLVFLNPDAFPEPDWLAQLLALAERYPDAAAIGSTQRADAPGILDGAGDVLHASGLAYRSSHRKRATPSPLGETFSACAAAMLVRREAYERMGGFDEDYFAFFEDVDFGFRLRLAGGRILQSPDAIVTHIGGGAGGSSSRAHFLGARNRVRTFVKCMPEALFWPLLPVHVLACAAASTASILKGRGIAAWQGTLTGLSDVGALWPVRRAIQRQRVARTADIARALAWSPFVFFGRQPVIRPLTPRAQRQDHEQQPAEQ
ncbi:MAG: glycosyltransferase family 2 protein [Hyphomonadaceae bacterium]|nr:glycosyltransferase family 2 protein [Hyphomonadaceae bacterium]